MAGWCRGTMTTYLLLGPLPSAQDMADLGGSVGTHIGLAGQD
jgi:hypothetical protein